MNLQRLLHSPAPPHAFALGGDGLAYARLSRARDRLLALRHCPLPHGWFELGPVGVLHVDRVALDGALAALLEALDAPAARASLVVPNSWVRTLIAEAGELPKGRAEAEETLRWKLKKLLPCRPEEARLDFVPLPGNGRAWVVLALERPLTLVEEVFAGRGVTVGRIEPVAIALMGLLPDSPTGHLLLCLDRQTFTVTLVVGGAVRLVRHKLLPALAAEQAVVRELATTVAFVRERERLDGTLTLLLAAAVEEVRAAVLAWAAGQEGVVAHPIAVGDARLGSLGAVDPITAWALLATGARAGA